MWLNGYLGLSIKMGTNIEANNNRRKKSFKRYVTLLFDGGIIHNMKSVQNIQENDHQ